MQLELSSIQLQNNMIWAPLAFRLPDIHMLRMRNPELSRETYPNWKRGKWPQASVVYMNKIQPVSWTVEGALQIEHERLEWGINFKERWAQRPLLPRSTESDIASPPSFEEILSDIGSLPDEEARRAEVAEQRGELLQPAE